MQDLFGGDTPMKEPKQNDGLRFAERAYKTLTNTYGTVPDKRCKQCKHFIAKRFATTYFKCGLTNHNHSIETDWRANWTACGKFEQSIK